MTTVTVSFGRINHIHNVLNHTLHEDLNEFRMVGLAGAINVLEAKSQQIGGVADVIHL